MFAATMEGGNIRSSGRVKCVNSGSAVFIDIDVVDDLVMNVDPIRTKNISSNISTNNRPTGEIHKDAIDYLHKIGVIDAFGINQLKTDRRADYRKLILKELWDAYAKKFCRTLERKGVDPHKANVFFDIQNTNDGLFRPSSSIPWEEVFSGTKLYCRQKNKHEASPSLYTEGRAFVRNVQNEIHQKFYIKDHLLNEISERFVANLGKVTADFLTVGPRFFVLNDVYFLRRIALGAQNWEAEALSRLCASPYCYPDDQTGVPKQTFGENIRLDRYIERFRIYAGHYWHNGFDLVYTNEAFRGEQYDRIS